MTRQGVGTVWHFELQEELADVAAGIDGVIVHAEDTDYVYLLIDSDTFAGRVPLRGPRTPEDLGMEEIAASATAVVTIDDDTLSHTNVGAIGDRLVVADDGGFALVQLVTPAKTFGNFTDPAAITSATGQMAGLGATFTPGDTWVSVTIDGDVTLGTNSATGSLTMRYGTGTAPANGDAATGTAIDKTISWVASNANFRVPFSLTRGLDSLTPGTDYWLDVAEAATAGTVQIRNVSIALHEL